MIYKTIDSQLSSDYTRKVLRLFTDIGMVDKEGMPDHKWMAFDDELKDAFMSVGNEFLKTYIQYYLEPKFIITLPLLKHDTAKIVYDIRQMQDKELKRLARSELSFVASFRQLYLYTKVLDLFYNIKLSNKEDRFYSEDELNVFGGNLNTRRDGIRILDAYHSSLLTIADAANNCFDSGKHDIYFCNYISIHDQMADMFKYVSRTRRDIFYKRRDSYYSEDKYHTIEKSDVIGSYNFYQPVKIRRTLAKRYLIYVLLKGLDISFHSYISYCLFALDLEMIDIFLVFIDLCETFTKGKKDYNISIFSSKLERGLDTYLVRCEKNDRMLNGSKTASLHSKIDKFIDNYKSDPANVEHFISCFNGITYNKRFNVITYLFEKYETPDKYNSNYFDKLDILCRDLIRYYSKEILKERRNP